MPYAIDLFSGAGGMSEGLLQAGFNIVYSSDINEDVKKTYTNRHEQLGLVQGYNTFFEQADIRELPSNKIIESINSLQIFKGNGVKNIDAIFGGPPCQGFSRAGRRNSKDPRNTLFKEYLRIVNDIRPSYVVMENVEGFLDTKLENFVGVRGKLYNGEILMPALLEEEFNEIGYKCLQPKVLDASDYGVPQRRKRVIFLAYLKTMNKPNYPLPTTPKPDDKVTVLDAISDLILEPSKKEKYPTETAYQLASKNGRTAKALGIDLSTSNIDKLNHGISTHTPLIRERFSLFEEGESSAMLKRRIMQEGIDLSETPLLVNLCLKNLDKFSTREEVLNAFQNAEVDETMIQTLLTKKSNRFRLHAKQVSPTMVTLPDDYLTPFENRIPTVREMARIQSFDDSFEFLGKRTTGGKRRSVEVPQYTQVGNAVPPLLAKEIALEIKKAIQSSKNAEKHVNFAKLS
ncbi:DNA cytosine methyltransferase [Salinicoccus roseus]|uniref:DNA cytosine methyltransferase n=1 Tax=Salinicoccus roseus TaxID=45670 RepID=UPI002300C1D4|nr:DNA cytosine methyltransferase [Salinicoccus roseus]